jgi:ABC-type nitrate/sulfonate/bicarbonate transport system permease component
MQTDLMFAALLVLAVMALGLYALVDRGLRLVTNWQPENGYA